MLTCAIDGVSLCERSGTGVQRAEKSRKWSGAVSEDHRNWL